MQSPAQAAPTQSGGNPAVLLGLVGLVAGGVLVAKQTQPQSDSNSSGGGGAGGAGPSASRGGQAPQSAGAYVHTPTDQLPLDNNNPASTCHCMCPIPGHRGMCEGLEQ